MVKAKKCYYLNINKDYSWELNMSNGREVFKFYLGNCDKFCKENFRSSIFVVLTALGLDIDDKEEFIHLGEGLYRTKWGIVNNSIHKTPLEAFDKSKFTFYYGK